MPKYTVIYLFAQFVWCCQLSAQYDRVDVFPELDGAALQQALVDNYKPSNTLSYGDARDLLFGDIDLINDSLYCVYTGYPIYISPNLDPTTTAFDQGINTEHTFPRSKGADNFTLGYSDMHHLYATRVEVNTARGSLPMKEITDFSADEWFYLDNELTNIPNTNIDLYSEYQVNVGFEPREDHKGNVARSYFYFYTMYQFESDVADPTFFSSQVDDMCNWHYADPVDKREWDRSKNIAAEQGNENPFILDCRLARLYCNGITEACLTVSADDIQTSKALVLLEGSLLKISGILEQSTVYVINSIGQIQYNSPKVREDVIMDLSDLQTGMYFVTIISETGHASTHKVVK